MTNELTNQSNWETMKEQANVFIKSGFLPSSINTPEKAIAIGMTGKELGLSFMEAVRSINVIAGKPTISPQLMLALANRSKELQDIHIDANKERCIVTVTRKGRQPHKEEFGVKEATDLQLIAKDNYKKQPATMFKWRALAAALRVTFPDVMLGFYTPEELGAEVKVGEGEEMEVVSVPGEGEEYPVGIRVPKQYWDIRNTEPEKAQELLGGKGYYPKKTPTGYFIYTRDKSGVPATPPEVAPEPPKIEQKPPVADKLSAEEQQTILTLLNERGIELDVFKAYVKTELGAKGWNTVKGSDYPKIYEWIIKTAKTEVKS